MDLTDQQWTIIEPLFEEKRRPDGRGARGATRVARCAWRDARAVTARSVIHGSILDGGRL
jgi:transposase